MNDSSDSPDMILQQRRAGVLLHITSLPGLHDQGDMGEEAYRFIDFLAEVGASVWQTLPLGMPHGDRSPYQCLSAHAGNPELISIEWLIKKDWLDEAGLPSLENCLDDIKFRHTCFKTCFLTFKERADKQDIQAFEKFCREKSWWLDDFALFLTLKKEFEFLAWSDWPVKYKNRDAVALAEVRKRLAYSIKEVKFEQFVFFQQWHELREYARQKNIALFGDIPIFVAYDSADVWAHRNNFKLNEDGSLPVVAGVPPDYFSQTGQRWGNPLFNWKYLQENGFQWWLDRIRTQMQLFDIIRIDHFRGLQAAWEIPADQETAVNGQWLEAPGEALLNKIQQALGAVPLVAEDLGIITPEVEALRDKFNLPGMKILQFAFSGGIDNPYLPFNYPPHCVVYTGTHDNDTTLGWYEKISDQEKHYVQEYLNHPQDEMPAALVNAALASVANLAIIPMQDILKLGSQHRMNTPGTTEGNWCWRFQWEKLSDAMRNEFAHNIGLYGRRLEPEI